MKLRYLKEFLYLVAIVFVVAAIVASIYRAKTVVPPKIAIKFQAFKPDKTRVFFLKPDTNDNNEVYFDGLRREDWWFSAFPSFQNFSTEQTNTFCTLYLTNQGSARIWWVSLDCQVEARTPNGWITNRFGHFTTSVWSVGPSSRDDFNVYVPADAIEWRVTGQYSYFKNHNARLEFVGWLVDDLKFTQTGKSPSKVVTYPLLGIAWVLSLLPEPESRTVKIQSDLFTNHPPMVSAPTKIIP